MILKDDFEYVWKYRGTVPHLDHVNTYELNLAGFSPPDQAGKYVWVPCTLVSQRPDGGLEVMAAMDPRLPGQQSRLSCVTASQIRVKVTGKLLEVPGHVLKLLVPKSNPMNATVELDGRKVTHLLGRGPTEDHQEQRVKITVPRDRESLTFDCGPQYFRPFLSGEVLAPAAGGRDSPRGLPPTKLRQSWILQVGPSVKHEIEIEKRYSVSAIVALIVDGTTLLEAKAEDFDCPDKWDATFALFGERYIDWDLFETDRWGAKLDSRSTITQPLKYTHSINVSVPNLADLTNAVLSVDGVPYHQLKIYAPYEETSAMTLQPEVAYLQYKMAIPYKIRLDPQDTTFGQAQILHSTAEASLRPLSQAATAMQPLLDKAGQQMGAVGQQMGDQLSDALGSLQQKMGDMFRSPGGYSASTDEVQGTIAAKPTTTSSTDEVHGAVAARPSAISETSV